MLTAFRKRSEAETYRRPYDLAAKIRLRRFEDISPLRRGAERLAEIVEYQTFDHYWGDVPSWRLAMRGRSGPRVMPDFACLGTIKSGTSDLAANLMLHPSIVAPFAKEIFTIRTDDWRPYYPTEAEMAEVRETTGTALTGYFTPILDTLPLADNFHAARPDAKAILMLRDPVARAYSHYKWELFVGGPALQRDSYFASYGAYVDLALEMFPTPPPAATPKGILQCGIYTNAVRHWRRIFGDENVLIICAEDYFAEPASVLAQVYEFLGLPFVEPPQLERLNENPMQCPPEDEASRRKLSEFFKPYSAELYDEIGRDLHWQ